MPLHGSNIPAYAARVIAYSENSPQDSLYHGKHYQPLANFLFAHYGDSPREPTYPVPGSHRDLNDAWYYLLHREVPRAPKRVMSLGTLKSLRRDHANWQPGGGLLFLRGYPSPEWLTSIGSQYDVNPEFWARHLDFLSAASEKHSETPLILPSSSDDVFGLRFTTVGSRGEVSRQLDQAGLQKLRESCARQMDQYDEKLRSGHLNHEWRHGDSIIRRLTIHDQEYFSVDQVGTIYLSRPDEASNNWLIIIFLDSGKDLNASPPGPWHENSSQTDGFYAHFLPVSLYHKSIALNPDYWKDTELHNEPRPAITQSLRQIHLRYGRLLDKEIMQNDAFYALTELFSFFIAAEAQVLKTVEITMTKVSDLVDGNGSDINAPLRNQQFLAEHILDLKTTSEFVKRRGSPTWPKGSLSTDQRTKAEATAVSLEQDLEYLLRRAESLRFRSERALAMAVDIANITEARRGIVQGHNLFKFTVVASFYIPFSFVSSFFGMNFKELGTGSLHVWLFFAVAAPIFGVSVLFLFLDWRTVQKLQHHIFKNGSDRSQGITRSAI